MTLLTIRDFETRAGQSKIIMTIHKLEQKVHTLKNDLDELMHAQEALKKDIQGY